MNILGDVFFERGAFARERTGRSSQWLLVPTPRCATLHLLSRWNSDGNNLLCVFCFLSGMHRPRYFPWREEDEREREMRDFEMRGRCWNKIPSKYKTYDPSLKIKRYLDRMQCVSFRFTNFIWIPFCIFIRCLNVSELFSTFTRKLLS